MKSLKLDIAGLGKLKTDEVVARLCYASPSVQGCRSDDEALWVTLADDAELERVQEAFARIRADVASARLIAPRVTHERDVEALDGSRRDTHDLGESGYEALASYRTSDECRAAVHSYIDLIVDVVHAERRSYPVLIPDDHMRRCDYQRRFPQHVMYAGQYTHDDDSLRGGKDGGPMATEASGYMLSPAVCFHAYHEYGDAELSADLVLDATGRCFRHEASARTSRVRLLEFSMREIILMGGPSHVENVRRQLIEKTWKLFSALDLAGRIETASDPFYATGDLSRSLYQHMAAVKYELVCSSSGGDIAITSFNNVAEDLTSAYRVELAGEGCAHSGCVAFGIERWIHVLIDRFGPEPDAWPTASELRAAIGWNGPSGEDVPGREL